MIEDRIFCSSSFLSFRTLVDDNKSFGANVTPRTFHAEAPFYGIETVQDIKDSIKEYIDYFVDRGEKVALMLSGGIDSAILAKYLPEGTKAYTFRSPLEGTIDESVQASLYAKATNLDHEIIDIEWDDFLEYTPDLMNRQGYPVHSIAPQIYKVAKKAKADGYTILLFGENADCIFGGQDGLFGKRRSVEEFAERYRYVNPSTVLKDAVDITYPFEQYSHDGIVDTQQFMQEVYLRESTYSYVNACDAAGIKFASPYSKMRLNIQLDIDRIGAGEGKYMLREVFNDLYPDLGQPKKIPMPRAVDKYLKDWVGPTRPEFREDIDINSFSGDQKWMIYALEWYLNILSKDKI